MKKPALFSINIENTNNSCILNIIDRLDSIFKSKKFLTGEEFTVADVVLWSSLYAIITEPKLVSQYLVRKFNIITWFNEIKSYKHVTTALSKWSSKTGLEVLKYFSVVNWYSTGVSLSEISKMSIVEKDCISDTELNEVKKAWVVRNLLKPKSKSSIVLPQIGEKNILITSALPYVNNVPHLGNIIGCVLSADVFARYCRLRNWNILYIAGTDEYGTATETKALEEKLTPQEICDKYFQIHQDIYSWFNISFDYFGRTTTKQQKIITQELFMEVHKNNLTSVASVEQLLCESCNRFLADRFVEGICPKCKYEDARGDQCDGCGQLINAVELIKPKCKVCKTSPVIKYSEQLFLELPKIEPVIRDWVEKTSVNWTHNAREITNAWLKDGLKARCITRDLKWGVPVPLAGFENKVFYVWFDAPIGYMSITACYTDQWRKWWQPAKNTPVTYYQFMAKDNVPFHSVMFPATLFAINKDYLLVNNIMATEYLNYEDGKFSKSRGVGVFGTDAKNTDIPADVFRFYLLYVRPESQDSSFSWIDLATKHNSELLNNIGNFANRALVFLEKYFDSTISAMKMTTEEFTLLALIKRELCAYNAALEKGKLRDGIKYMLNISRHGNQYMQNQKPWILIKNSAEEKIRAGTVIGVSCNIACLLSIIIHPYMPTISVKMRKQMNVSEDTLILTDEVNMLLPENHKIGKPVPIFSKIEMSTVESLKKLFSGKRTTTSVNDKTLPAESVVTKQNYSGNIKSVQDMEAAILEQGNVVRNLKKSGVEKSQWLPHLNALLDMKKQVEEMKKNNNKTSSNNMHSENGDTK